MPTRLLAAALAVLLCCAASAAQEESGVPPRDEAYPAFIDVPELTAGFNLLYQQKFEEARVKFSDWGAHNPADPFGPTAIAGRRNEVQAVPRRGVR